MSKAACVIGANGGIGSAVVAALTQAGWSPVLRLDRDGPIAIDVSDEASVARAFDQVHVTKVIADTTESNPASIGVLRRCGFLPTGATRKDGTLQFERRRTPIAP